MHISERRMAIFKMLQKDKKVSIDDLAKAFDVSTMTIRRDLQRFEDQGYVEVDYGYAYINELSIEAEPSFAAKSNACSSQKLAIARTCAELIEEGDTIILDCGTTTLQLLKCIKSKNVRIITNSIPACALAGCNDHIELVVVPGVYNEVSAGLLGELTVDFYNRLHVDKAFLGAEAISAISQISAPTLEDVPVKRAMMNASNHKYLMIDSSKVNKVGLMQQANLSEFDKIYIDDDISDEDYKELQSVSGNIVLCS